MDHRRRWRRANVPIPEAHVGGLALGFVLQALRPWPLGLRRWVRRTLGWSLLGAGLAVVAWAVRAVGGAEVARPSTLVTSGPYRRSRNPMYVGWTAILAGVGLLWNAAWLLATLPLVLAATHRTVRREERALADRFGDRFEAYRRSVPRYL